MKENLKEINQKLNEQIKKKLGRWDYNEMRVQAEICKELSKVSEMLAENTPEEEYVIEHKKGRCPVCHRVGVIPQKIKMKKKLKQEYLDHARQFRAFSIFFMKKYELEVKNGKKNKRT